MNSRMAWSYERFELADVRLFKTADFDCSRSGNLSTLFGTRLRLLFAIGSGLQCRSEKRGPLPDLLTSRAFTGTDRGLLRSVLGPWSPVPKCEAPGAPISVEEHTSMAPGPRCQSQNPSLQNSSAIPA